MIAGIGCRLRSSRRQAPFLDLVKPPIVKEDGSLSLAAVRSVDAGLPADDPTRAEQPRALVQRSHSFDHRGHGRLWQVRGGFACTLSPARCPWSRPGTSFPRRRSCAASPMARSPLPPGLRGAPLVQRPIGRADHLPSFAKPPCNTRCRCCRDAARHVATQASLQDGLKGLLDFR
jgi:hypothetical protein